MCIVSVKYACAEFSTACMLLRMQGVLKSVFAQLMKTERKGHLQNTRHTTLAVNCFCIYCMYMYNVHVPGQCQK